MGTTLQEHLKPLIVEQLEAGPLTTQEVADKLARNYFTVRASIRQLLNEGLITPVDYSSRNTKYKVASGNGPNRIIPTLSLNGSKFKLNEVLPMRHNTEPSASVAVKNFPMHVTQLLRLSERLNSNFPEQEMSLQALRIRMENDFQALKNAADVYEQVLSNTFCWSADTLKKFPNDTSYNAEEVDEAYKFYFKEE